jgi:hypothetical protein
MMLFKRPEWEESGRKRAAINVSRLAHECAAIKALRIAHKGCKDSHGGSGGDER